VTIRVISGRSLHHRPAGRHCRWRGFPAFRGWCARSILAGISRATLDFGAMIVIRHMETGGAFNALPDHGRVATSVSVALQADKLVMMTGVARHPATGQQARQRRQPSIPNCRWPLLKHCWPKIITNTERHGVLLQQCVRGLTGPTWNTATSSVCD
jgi:hypothetical protein